MYFSAGVETGLRLTLNVEQYEYMTGPHDAAGLKMLLHDSRELPSVHGLGEAVATGTHSFVGVRYMLVNVMFFMVKRSVRFFLCHQIYNCSL